MGISQINLEELLKSPIRKTSNSYARVYDAWVPVDETDEISKKPLRKIALLRVILYLEDLGPITNSRFENNEEFENEIKKEGQNEKPTLIPEYNNKEKEENDQEEGEEDEEKVKKINYSNTNKLLEINYGRNELFRV